MFDLNAPIQRVTVLEDRAFLRRSATLQLPAGLSRWRLQRVSSLVVDKTAVAQLSGTAQLKHLRVERRKPPVPPPPPPEPEEQVSQRVREVRRLQHELTLLDRELQSAQALYADLLGDISAQSGWNINQQADWEQQLRELLQWKRELRERRQSLVEEMEACSRPPALPSPPKLSAEEMEVRTDIVLEIDSPQEQTVELLLDYCVPSACWRPYHRAIWSGEKVHFHSQGCLWQNTGEDWTDVEVILSTQRLSLGTTPPKLTVDRIRTQKKSSEVVVEERDQEIEELQPMALSAPEIPGIDDGGQVLNLRSPNRCTVPSHGQPVRVPLFQFEAPSQMENVLMGEVCSQVLQQTRLVNPTSQAVLAGPVDLIRESGWIGRTRIDYVGAGERFLLGWGPHSSLRAVRQTSQGGEEKDDLLGGWVKTRHSVKLTLSNLSPQSLGLRVVERIPVSELKQVEVVFDPKGTSPAAAPDENGFLTWNLDIGPRGGSSLSCNYSIRRRKEVEMASPAH